MRGAIQRGTLVEQRGVLGPSWRHHLATNSKLQTQHAGDPILRECHRYLSLQQEGTRGCALACQQYPNVAAAFELNASAKSPKIKIMVTADMPAAEIAQRLSVDVVTLEYW